MLLPSVTVRWYQFVYKLDQKPEALVTRLRSWFQLHVKELCVVVASCEPGETVQLCGGSGYCISAENAGIRCTTHELPNLLVLVLENSCASLVTHCHGSVSHELHCWLLGDTNAETLTVPVVCISMSNSVVPISSRGSSTGPFFTVFWSALASDTHF